MNACRIRIFSLACCATAWALACPAARSAPVGASELAQALDDWIAEAPDAQPSVVATDQSLDLQNPSDPGFAMAQDGLVEPAQAAQPLGGLALGGRSTTGRSQVSTRRATAASGVALGGLASTPYMIGDTGAGTCLGFGGVFDAEVSHPTLACGRLNIAENNSPLPTNRLYMSYRHFENASPVSVFQFGESFNIDRWTLASERTFLDGMASWEVRLPINYQLRRDIISVFDNVSGLGDIVADKEREADLGNLAIILKCLLWEGDEFALSGGLGITVPTARDVRYRVAFRAVTGFEGFPDFSTFSLTTFDTQFENETVYLAPFLSWLYAPEGRWFHQGFLQVETAANPSTVTAEGLGLNTYFFQGNPIGTFDYDTEGPQTVDLYAQTLMRLNLGVGYHLMDNPRASFIQRLTGLAEMHYTTTLNDANLSPVPTTVTSAGIVLVDIQDINIGNQANRVDILNAALGLQADMGPFIVTNGFVAPVRQSPDRGFDFEYNFQVQLPY